MPAREPPTPELPIDVGAVVSAALAEDVGTGDLTARLLGAKTRLAAEIWAREPAVLCGAAWFDEVFRQLDGQVAITWHLRDGARCSANALVCRIEGPARPILTGERTALNFLQTLSGTATVTRAYCEAIAGTGAEILDTRKTLPGLRLAQKYAVGCGGGTNHRLGLYDAILIKENHISAIGTVGEAVGAARRRAEHVTIEVEVETMTQLEEALDAEADTIMLDNFPLDQVAAAVRLRNARPGRRTALEYSGSVDLNSVRAVAETGVDYISVGALTKHVTAVDFSMRVVEPIRGQLP